MGSELHDVAENFGGDALANAAVEEVGWGGVGTRHGCGEDAGRRRETQKAEACQGQSEKKTNTATCLKLFDG